MENKKARKKERGYTIDNSWGTYWYRCKEGGDRGKKKKARKKERGYKDDIVALVLTITGAEKEERGGRRKR
jgi:hypothetical protein